MVMMHGFSVIGGVTQQGVYDRTRRKASSLRGSYPLESSQLKELCLGQQCLHLFPYSEAYHEQMGPIPSSPGSLNITLSNVYTYSPSPFF